MAIYISTLIAFSLLGMIWLGIRSERQKKERMLNEAIRSLTVVSISKGNRRRM